MGPGPVRPPPREPRALGPRPAVAPHDDPRGGRPEPVARLLARRPVARRREPRPHDPRLGRRIAPGCDALNPAPRAGGSRRGPGVVWHAHAGRATRPCSTGPTIMADRTAPG